LIFSHLAAISTGMEERTAEWLRQSDYDMDKAAVVDIVDRLRQGLEARGIKLQRIVLYSSYATGANKKGSDIDVVVVSSDFVTKSYWERIDLLADVLYEIFAPVEAVAMTPDEWERGNSFVADFARKGEILYAA